jgi:hypothetical protein
VKVEQVLNDMPARLRTVKRRPNRKAPLLTLVEKISAMKVAAFLLFLSATIGDCRPQQQLPSLTATPNRPTVTNTAETVQFGVLEVELGIGSAPRRQSLQGLLKFGLLRDVELDWAGNPWQRDAAFHYSAVGDNNPGIRWRFRHQSKRQPTLTVEYSAKLPSMGPVAGSGEVDHAITLLASKDLPKRFHIDANLGYGWLGRPAGGFDHNWLPSGTLSYALTDKAQVAMEISGASRANAFTPALTQNLWAVSYTLRPRMVLDSAVQFRVTGQVPRVVYLGGFTYSITDIYHHRR